MKRRALCALFLAVVGCGGESEPSTRSGDGTAGASTDPPAQPTPNQPASESTATAPAVAVRNTGSSPRWVIVDFQSTPVDFQIGQPPLQLNAYGGYWCGGPSDNHNDPGVRLVEIAAGETVSLGWRAISVTRAGDCWKGAPLAAGSYPTKVCFYEQAPADLRVPGDVSDTIPRTCIDTTIIVPAAASGITFDL